MSWNFLAVYNIGYVDSTVVGMTSYRLRFIWVCQALLVGEVHRIWVSSASSFHFTYCWRIESSFLSFLYSFDFPHFIRHRLSFPLNLQWKQCQVRKFLHKYVYASILKKISNMFIKVTAKEWNNKIYFRTLSFHSSNSLTPLALLDM